MDSIPSVAWNATVSPWALHRSAHRVMDSPANLLKAFRLEEHPRASVPPGLGIVLRRAALFRDPVACCCPISGRGVHSRIQARREGTRWHWHRSLLQRRSHRPSQAPRSTATSRSRATFSGSAPSTALCLGVLPNRRPAVTPARSLRTIAISSGLPRYGCLPSCRSPRAR